MGAGSRSPYPGAVARIEGFSTLASDWNGQHAAAISADIQKQAVRFLELVWGQFRYAVPEPTVVAPTSDGGVAFEWIVTDADAERGVEIVLLPGRFEYSVRNRGTGRLEEDWEGGDVGVIFSNVLKARVAGHKVVSR